MQSSICKFIKFSRCSLVEALEAASLHPARAMGIQVTSLLPLAILILRSFAIQDRKGQLDYGADADFVLLQPGELTVLSTWIAGERVFDINGHD